MVSERRALKRKTDYQIISEWIEPGARVLDLGCGRGVFAEHLKRDMGCYVVGVDIDIDKVQSCVKRGVNVYQADIRDALQTFGPGSFDWVVCSRTLQQLQQPMDVLSEALRVGKHFVVGFTNDAFWRNRWSHLVHGRRVINEVFPEPWHRSRPVNPVTIDSFRAYCREAGVTIERSAFLRGDWQSPQRTWPNLLAGYAIFELRGRTASSTAPA